jgi:hypothetical protein
MRNVDKAVCARLYAVSGIGLGQSKTANGVQERVAESGDGGKFI